MGKIASKATAKDLRRRA